MVTACPNCGAPVDLKAANSSDDPKCPFCQYALPEVAPVQAPTGTFTPAGGTFSPAPGGVFIPASVTTGRRSGCVGPVIGVAIFLAVGGAILAAVLAAT